MLSAIVLATAAHAQPLSDQIVDGSGMAFDETDLAEVLLQVRGRMPVPESAKFRLLRRGTAGSVLCGEVSSRDRHGAELGFQPFYFDLPTNRVEIMPDPESALFPIWIARSGMLCG